MTSTSPSRAHTHESDPTLREVRFWPVEGNDDEGEDPTLIRLVERPRGESIAIELVPRPAPPPRGEVLVTRRSELVEQLSLPHGLREDALPAGERPRDPAQTRIALIRLVRKLGGDYRRWYGTPIRTDAAAVEAMQRHLLGRASEVRTGAIDALELAAEIVRHGMLLGEIVARRAGGVWADLAGVSPEHWQMGVPSGQVVCPAGRVHRFLLKRTAEEDLVAFYLRLEAAATGDA